MTAKDTAVAENDIYMEVGATKSKEELISENLELQKKAKHAVRFALVMGILLLVAMGAVVGLLINRSLEDDSDDSEPARTCGSMSYIERTERFVIGEPNDPGPFHDLTAAEIKRVRTFLEEDPAVLLAKPDTATLKDAHVYMMDLQPPKKEEALAYLDHHVSVSSPPSRYARVILLRGDLNPPVVEERLCGPLDNITSCDVDVTVPFAQRPIEYREYSLYDDHLIKEIQRMFGNILKECYGGSIDFDECEDDCLNYYVFPVVIKRYGNDSKRRVWILLVYDVSYMSLYPLSFGALCDVDGVDETQFSVEKVWFDGTLYNSPQEVINAFTSGSTRNNTCRSYPTEEESVFSTFKRRGPHKPAKPQRAPELTEPDGKRYTIHHRKVEYLDMWSFHYRMSTIHGPALYDIRFLGERIAYEISLSELAVFYSGSNSMQRQSFYVDTSVLSGSRSKVLMAGVDCPTTATFLPFTVTSQSREEPVVFPQSICVFEQNLGMPLKRHHAYSADEGAFYGGMADTALIVRSIHVVDNYDYIIDFKFHQNGAMGVSVGQTGYLLASYYDAAEKPYGVKITDYIYGGVHLHVANFKVDIDINGTSNRYETLDIEEDSVLLREATNPDYSQTKFSFNLKSTEQQAAYKHDFNKPMYHIFHNDAARNAYGERKSFRLTSSGFAKQMLKENVGDEGVLPFARYQVAVSQQNDNERTSTSPYAQWGGAEDPIKFETFISDDQNIVDKDLVAWVTLAVHHIPHTEDLPVTSTPGKPQSFYLFPYNYFKECPSVMSRDSVYVTHIDEDTPEKGLNFEHSSIGDVCQYEPYNITSLWKMDPDQLFETTYHHGIL